MDLNDNWLELGNLDLGSPGLQSPYPDFLDAGHSFSFADEASHLDARLAASPVPALLPPLPESTSPPSLRAAPSRRKGRTLRDRDWEPMRDRIFQLYRVENRRLQDVKEIVGQEFQFEATPRQWKTRLSKWGMNKKVKSDEMAFIVQKQRERCLEPEKPERVFRLRGKIVPQEKIHRWKDRTHYHSPGPLSPIQASETPGGLSYWTASSDRGPVLTSPAITVSTPVHHPNALGGNLSDPSPAPYAATSTPRLRSQESLALAYQADGQVKKAIVLLEHIVAVQERTLAEDHPDRLEPQHDLALVYQQDGQVKKAIMLGEHVIAVRERTLAEDHPDRLGSQHNLALAYGQDGQVKKAIVLLEHIVAVRERTLAENHPNRLGSQKNLALGYRQDGQVKKAIMLLEHIVAVQERTLVEDHPDRLGSQHDLANAYREDGQVKKSIVLLEHVVAMQERTLAEDHPDRLVSQEGLSTLRN